MAEQTFHTTRLIFMGEAALCDGFRLIGFETHSDPDLETTQRLLGELVKQRQHAFVVIDQRISRSGASMLQQIRHEGGRIVLAEVPSLNNATEFHSPLDEQLRRLIGGTAMERQHESG